LISHDSVIRFDPSSKGNGTKNFISHSHGDHTMGFASVADKSSTRETHDIFVYGQGGRVRNFSPVAYGRELKVGDLEVIPHNAGHMLGSALFEVRTPNSTIVYTGDLNTVDTLTTRGAEPVECDTLVVESTYGRPRYVFPPREEIYTSMVKWALKELKRGSIPVFKVYPAGKAQEVIRLFNLFTKIPVVTHPSVTRVSNVHVKCGLPLEYVDASSEEGKELITSESCIYVVPMSWSSHDGREYSKAYVTGWAIRFKIGGVKAAFPLSSHADFEQLVSFAEESKAKRVYTVFGFTEALAKVIRQRLNVSARPLPKINQRTLVEFWQNGSQQRTRGL